MIELLTHHKIAVVFAVLILVGGMWYGLLGSSAASAPLLTTDAPAQGADQDLVSTLLQLRAVNLSGTIFSDPVFTSLKDFGKDIVPEPVGRPNPFAELSPVSQPTDTTTRGAQIFAPPTKKTR